MNSVIFKDAADLAAIVPAMTLELPQDATPLQIAELHRSIAQTCLELLSQGLLPARAVQWLVAITLGLLIMLHSLEERWRQKVGSDAPGANFEQPTAWLEWLEVRQ